MNTLDNYICLFMGHSEEEESEVGKENLNKFTCFLHFRRKKSPKEPTHRQSPWRLRAALAFFFWHVKFLGHVWPHNPYWQAWKFSFTSWSNRTKLGYKIMTPTKESLQNAEGQSVG